MMTKSHVVFWMASWGREGHLVKTGNVNKAWAFYKYEYVLIFTNVPY